MFYLVPVRVALLVVLENIGHSFRPVLLNDLSDVFKPLVSSIVSFLKVILDHALALFEIHDQLLPPRARVCCLYFLFDFINDLRADERLKLLYLLDVNFMDVLPMDHP